MEEELSSQIIKQKILPLPFKQDNYSLVRVTAESIYSVTKPDIAIDMAIDIMLISRKLNVPNKTICDATANIGGNTLAFSLYFQKIYALEIKKKTHEILHNNIKIYGANNVFSKCGNAFAEIPSIALCDIVFLDPPWYLGNRGKKNIHLQMTPNELPNNLIGYTYSIEHFIQQLWEVKRIPVFVKVPPKYKPIIVPYIRLNYKKMDLVVFA
jgi:16S rRNA G966 N2-methylase RsmD